MRLGSDIVLISYPSGGFGNFLYYVLSNFSSNTVKIETESFKFSVTGDSHSIKKYTNVYYMEPDFYELGFEVETDLKKIILCDNGIKNDSYSKISKTFPNATILRINIDKDIRPVVYHACVVKAMNMGIDTVNAKNVVSGWIDHDQNYSVRENFTLFYHNWPFKWEPVDGVVNISLEKLITDPVNCIKNIITAIGGETINEQELKSSCANWVNANKKYFDIYYDWAKIESALINNHNLNLKHITSLHSQGYINYRIEKLFEVTIPVYDYRDWFVDTNAIQKMISHEK